MEKENEIIGEKKKVGLKKCTRYMGTITVKYIFKVEW